MSHKASPLHCVIDWLGKTALALVLIATATGAYTHYVGHAQAQATNCK